MLSLSKHDMTVSACFDKLSMSDFYFACGETPSPNPSDGAALPRRRRAALLRLSYTSHLPGQSVR